MVTTAKEPLSPWRGSANDFRDSQLLELTGPVEEIEVQGPDNFTLQRQGSNGWRIVGQNFPRTPKMCSCSSRSSPVCASQEFVQDVVTAPDLPKYGLETPARQRYEKTQIN